jgi:hypothetical protein
MRLRRPRRFKQSIPKLHQISLACQLLKRVSAPPRVHRLPSHTRNGCVRIASLVMVDHAVGQAWNRLTPGEPIARSATPLLRFWIKRSLLSRYPCCHRWMLQRNS